MATKKCKGCGSTTRKLSHPGPRCLACWRIEKKRRAAAAHDRMVSATYGLQPGQYEQLYAAQGGKCAICQRATGRTKRLAVDHDHETGEVRGLLCGPCNFDLIGKNPPEAIARALAYIYNPPARKVLR